ncbi:MAG: hypothetical protein ACOYIS_07015 [Candidatus Cloacimonadaceae bacterium]
MLIRVIRGEKELQNHPDSIKSMRIFVTCVMYRTEIPDRKY